MTDDRDMDAAFVADVDALALREKALADAQPHPEAVVVEQDVHENTLVTDDAAFPNAPFSVYGDAIRSMWSEPDSSDVQVRGANYLVDQIKVPSGDALGKLLHVDVLNVADVEDRHHIAVQEEKRPHSVLKYCREAFPDSMVFILNMELPNAEHTCIVSYWLLPKLRDAVSDTEHDPKKNFQRLLWSFCNAEDDAFRTQRFKLIPDFQNAPWVFQTLVPSRPVLSGNKLTQHYFRRHNYFELDLDIASSTAATYIGSLCCSWATYLDVQIFMTIQGEEADELPERVIGGVSFKYLDISLAETIEQQ
ncbi:Ribosome functionion factor 1, partial [Globisporangium splendens]